MLLAQDPKVLLVDEPAAGMTDAETADTADLLRSRSPASIPWWWSSTTWTSSARSAVKVTVLHEGSVLAEGSFDQVSSSDPKRHRRLSGEMTLAMTTAHRLLQSAGPGRGPLLTVKRTRSALRRCAGAARRLDRGRGKPGEVTCILGRNGVGKTSLMRAVCGQHAPSVAARLSGRAGHHPRRKTRRTKRARRASRCVPQGREIFPLLTVRENLETGFAAAGRARINAPSRTRSSTLFPVLREMLGRRGGDLSGGQQQQLAIGRALVMRPKPPDPRRADGGHPALDHQGYRPRHRCAPRPRRHGDPAR